MARHPFASLQTRRDDFGDEPYFLDPLAIEDWLRWLAIEPHFADAARERRLRVVVFKAFLTHLSAAEKTTLRRFCEVDAAQIKADERWMVDEMLSLCLADDSGQMRRAELLVLARRRRQGRKLLLISPCARLGSLPNAHCFFFDKIDSARPWPVGFDLFFDFNFHPRLRDATQSALESGHYPQAIQAGVVALCKQVGHAFPASTQAEGLAQMDYVFSCDKSRDPNKIKEPRLRINDLASESDWNEALGYWKLFAGTPSALRNPVAHEEPDGQWIQSRFGDKVTVAKTLCFLSLLFEKLEARPRTP